MRSDEQVLGWARFVATKFENNVNGWVYTRNKGKLKHIRYESDYTGRNVWYKRFFGGLSFAWNHNIRPGKNSIARQLGENTKGRSLKERMIGFAAYFMVRVRKDKNLPDGILNGNPVFWEEDGEYGVLFGPTVGVKVLDFIEADPENPHAIAILEEMKRMAEKSFPVKEKEDVDTN